MSYAGQSRCGGNMWHRSLTGGVVFCLATVAGTASAGLAIALTVYAVSGIVRNSQHDARVAALRQAVRDDAAVARELQAEYDAHTAWTEARDARQAWMSFGLVASSLALVAAVKYRGHLTRRLPAAPAPVVAAWRARIAASSPPPEARSTERPASISLPVVEPLDVTAVDGIVARLGRGRDAAIPILHAVQEHYRYLPEPALQRVCERTEISPADLAGVASFYTGFRRTPVGRHVVTVCHGTACHVAGAERVTAELRRSLGLAPGADTDAAGEFTVQRAACLGCCTLAPVVQVDGATYGHVATDTAAELLEIAPLGNDGDRARQTHHRSETCGTDHRSETGATQAGATQAGATQDGATQTGATQAGATRADDTEAAEVLVGLGSCCVAAGSGAVYEALEAELAGIAGPVAVKRVGCLGLCHQMPMVQMRLPGREPAVYGRVQREDVQRLVRRHFRPRSMVTRLSRGAQAVFSQGARALLGREMRTVWYGDRCQPRPAPTSGAAIRFADPPVTAFLARQQRIATEHCGELDPLDFDEYREHGGWAALNRCRGGELTPDAVIAIVEQSGLRGRGGAGFPTGRKWSAVRRADGATRYVIVNGDEGDPGAFMDRMLMESYPYRIIEGASIAAGAVGAAEIIVYVRAEYPLAVERLTSAIAQCERRGLLAPTATGATPQSPHVRIVHGAGAFVCGEETALIASLEGRRGIPRLRPPYPAERGLNGCPTLVNNVETLSLVPWIVRYGPERFAALGTPTSRGTKVFALAGKVLRGGLIEVPMGITIREIVERIGGGVRPEVTASGSSPRQFKAVQIGGPSGGCVPASLADTPVDYEALAGVGAMMGSGGLVVLDDRDCLVDMARYFLAFTQSQSCGHCTPCRIGTRRMLDRLERLCAGHGTGQDIEELEELGRMIQATSLCGLGRTAPNPVLTTLRYFREEYEAHVQGRCPAGRCPSLVHYEVTDACTGCTICAQHCPVAAIELRPYERHEIDDARCVRCDGCRVRCPENAIRVV